MNTIRAMLPALAVVALSSCATTVPQTVSQSAAGEQVAAAREALNVAAQRGAGHFEARNEVWLGATAVDRLESQKLPAEFDRPVSFERIWSVGLHQIAEYLIDSHGLNVVVAEDAYSAAASVKRTTPLVSDVPAGLQGLPALPSQAAGGQAGLPQVAEEGMRIQYTGTVRGFLNHVTSRSNTSWRYSDGAVEIYHLDTQFFPVDVLPGTMQLSSDITNVATGGQTAGGAGGGAAQGGSQTQMQGGSVTSMNATVDQHDGVLKSVEGMLSEKGKATWSLDQLVVSDTPSVLRKVSRYIAEVNATARRQVAMDVKIYSVESNHQQGYSLRWDLVWQSLSKQAGISLGGGGNGVDGGNNLSYTVLGSGSPFAGTKAFLDVLATQGKVQQVTSATMVTLSGRPAPLQLAEEITYLQSTQVNLVPNVGQTISRTPGKITAGFSLALLPILTKSGSVLLQAQVNLASLREMRTIGTDADGGKTEMPLVDSRQLMQAARMEPGQTLILTGFEQETLRSTAKGMGNPNFTLLGGGKDKTAASSSLVVLITPRVTE